MLVLTRHKDQQIIIYDNIVITIVAINGLSVRVGIDAPRDIPINRMEVYNKIQDRLNEGDNDV